jgi:O-acetylserine/cysteine efflux transporter
MDRPASRAALVAATLGLFLVWSNTYIAFEVLLAPHAGRAPLDWWSLTVARMLPAGAVCAAWCFGARRRESMEIVRAHAARLVACGALVVLVYNCFLYDAIQHRVSGPIAAVVTTLTPLWLTLFGVAFLGEPLTRSKLGGLALGLAGMLLLASAKETPGETHGLRILEAAVAPLAWSVYTTLTKPVTRAHSPFLWTYLVLATGALLLLPPLAFTGAPDVTRLDGTSIAWLAFLALGASVGGNAAWSWLLRRLPASTVGLTVFLNPPLTLTSKFVLAALLPASFAFAVAPAEWAGGALMLGGVALAVFGGTGKSGPPPRRAA